MRIDTDVLAVLTRATTEGNALTLTGQLDRKLYERTSKALEAAGGKWNKKARAHVFEGDAGDALDQLVTTGEYRDTKRELQQFYTPPALAATLVQLAFVKPGSEVLEPSAGRGAIAQELRVAGAKVSCVELDPKNAQALHAAGFEDVRNCDFLSTPAVRAFDAVVMNPPFAGRADIRHVTHALGFVKRGGWLIAVMSAGVQFREDAIGRDFRALVAKRDGFIREVEDGAFKEAGTMVRTVIVGICA